MIWGLESGEEELVETEEMEEIMLHMGGRYMEQPGEPRGLGMGSDGWDHIRSGGEIGIVLLRSRFGGLMKERERPGACRLNRTYGGEWIYR